MEAVYSVPYSRRAATIVVSGRPSGDGKGWESFTEEKGKGTRYVLTVSVVGSGTLEGELGELGKRHPV